MRHTVEEGDDEVDPRPEDGPQATEAFDHVLFGLRHNADAKENADDDEDGDGKKDRIAAEKFRLHARRLLKCHMRIMGV